VYHQDRARDEQLRGPLAYKRKIVDIYEDMLDEWLPQGPYVNTGKHEGRKRIRGPHRRAAKRKRQLALTGHAIKAKE
jgi:hypothetical protein